MILDTHSDGVPKSVQLALEQVSSMRGITVQLGLEWVSSLPRIPQLRCGLERELTALPRDTAWRDASAIWERMDSYLKGLA